MSESRGAFLRSILTPAEAAAADWRNRLVRLLLAGALAVGLLTLVPSLVQAWGNVATLAISLVYVLLSAVVVLRAESRVQLAALVLILYALGLSEVLNSGNPGVAIFYFLAAVVFASLLWSLRAGAITGAAVLLTLGITGILAQTGAVSWAGGAGQAEWLRAVVAMLLASMAVIAGFQQLHRQLDKSAENVAAAQASIEKERLTLEERVEARTQQWRAGLEVAQAVNAIRDPDQLVAEVVNRISDRFGYYYAAIFLLDETGERAVLREATGEAGRLLKENRHSLPVGGQSMVGTAIAGQRARIALDTESETVRFANPLLPYTRSEIAVPLIVGQRVLGALDVQSTSPNAFGQAEIDTLQGMANQVALAFDNARLFQESQKNLADLEAVQRQYISSAWLPMAGRSDLQFRMGDEDSSPDSAHIDVPLSLRDQIIGEINLESAKDWTAEQRNLVEAIATQAALALENARLVEATQSTAQREHLLAEITTKVWSSATLDGILRTAVSELGTALGAEHATIELRMEDLNE
jgi:GAF domain-containing protein